MHRQTLEQERLAALSHLAGVVDILRHIGGYMSPEHQRTLTNARDFLRTRQGERR